MIEPNNKMFRGYKLVKKKENDYYDIAEYNDYNKYKKYINSVAPNIYMKLKDDGWVIKYNIFNVDGVVDDDNYKAIKKYDKIMCMTITKGDRKIFTEVKKSKKDKDDKIFMYNLALYRIWHELKKQKEKKAHTKIKYYIGDDSSKYYPIGEDYSYVWG